MKSMKQASAAVSSMRDWSWVRIWVLDNSASSSLPFSIGYYVTIRYGSRKPTAAPRSEAFTPTIVAKRRSLYGNQTADSLLGMLVMKGEPMTAMV